MITVKNVLNIAGEASDITLMSDKEHVIDAENKLTVFPACIATHTHMIGSVIKSSAWSAISGGITTFIDAPTDSTPCSTLEQLNSKKQLIERMLSEAKIPLRMHFYGSVDEKHIEQIGRIKPKIMGLSLHLHAGDVGPNLSDKALEQVFRACAQEDLIVAVTPPEHHPQKKVEQVLSLAEKYGTQVYLFNVKSTEELTLIRKAKQREVLVYAETSPQNLFLLDVRKEGQAPIKMIGDQHALWEAIRDETIDSVGIDQGHLGIADTTSYEYLLPLLLNACHEGKLSLTRVVELTCLNIERIFNLNHTEDIILVNLTLEKNIEVRGQNKKIRGWPVYTISQGQVFGAGV